MMTNHKNAETFYKAVRADRKYLPVWSKLTPKQQVKVGREFEKIEAAAERAATSIAQDIYGHIRLAKPKVQKGQDDA